jgi:hypothetical protein
MVVTKKKKKQINKQIKQMSKFCALAFIFVLSLAAAAAGAEEFEIKTVVSCGYLKYLCEFINPPLFCPIYYSSCTAAANGGGGDDTTTVDIPPNSAPPAA